jgi:hypothetical protein
VTEFRIKKTQVARKEGRSAQLEKQWNDLLILDPRPANISTDLIRPYSPASQEQALIFGNTSGFGRRRASEGFTRCQ